MREKKVPTYLLLKIRPIKKNVNKLAIDSHQFWMYSCTNISKELITFHFQDVFFYAEPA